MYPVLATLRKNSYCYSYFIVCILDDFHGKAIIVT